jgi:flagellar biosynthesis protein FlgN
VVPTPRSAALADLVAQELGLLQNFVALLRQEESLLTRGEANRLPQLAEEKSAIATKLGSLASAREDDLANRNLPAGRQGMDLWIASPDGASSRRRWEQLLVLAAEARMLNETNGKLIALQLDHNQQALNAIMAAVDKAATYGPDGQQKSTGAGRPLGSA